MTMEATTLGPRQVERPTADEAASRSAAIWQSVERLLVRAGDWLNPILVKETRQAVKSSQFTITFVLVLILCWVVTIGVIAAIGPRIYYSAEGGTLLAWYNGVLSFPLMLMVPLAAYRSLIAEREDNTYDLLAITTLKPRQIITGKLGSAVAQMAVYYSVVTPCIAFSYLLRGVDLPTIATLLVLNFFWSLGLSMIGILLATLTVQRFVQVFIQVAFVAGLLGMFLIAVQFGMSAGFYGRAIIAAGASSAREFVTVFSIMGTMYATSFALAYFAAAGMITFTSENRSTPLRICMIVQQAAFIGWMGVAWIEGPPRHEVVLVTAIVAGIYWYIMGMLLTAELPHMSQRVRRRLPQSFFGRMFFSWFNPGPASGYMFVIANISTIVVGTFFAIALGELYPSRTSGSGKIVEILCGVIVGWGYIVSYLGLGLLAIGLLRRVANVTMLACVLINFLLLLAGFGIPYAIKLMSVTMREVDYTFLQITDPIFSMWHILYGGLQSDANVLLVVIPGIAICVLLLNVPRIIYELRIVREEAPARVLEDEAELHPLPQALPQNPWDEAVQ